jgi:GNAT superfamily N-acetyltransferase
MRTALVAKLNASGRHYLSEQMIPLGDEGFTIVAMAGTEAIGVIAVCWKMLPAPFAETREAHIDLIDVDPEWRRQGIGRRLVAVAKARAAERGAYQIRAWTSESAERMAALAMWRGLGFAICPTEIVVGAQALRVRGCFVVQRLEGR